MTRILQQAILMQHIYNNNNSYLKNQKRRELIIVLQPHLRSLHSLHLIYEKKIKNKTKRNQYRIFERPKKTTIKQGTINQQKKLWLYNLNLT